ncbi:MAG: glycosyltransferase family 39 protein [Planctomycetota bacterium]
MPEAPPSPARATGARALLAALALALLVAAVAHVRGAGEHPNNQDRELDLLLARRIATQGILTDGARSPLFPLLLAPFQGGDPGFPQRARWVALALGGLAFGGVFLLLRSVLPERVAVVATLLAGPEWTFEVSRVRPEPLVAFALVALATALARATTSPRPLRLVAVAGVAAGLAHLGKGSGPLTVVAAVLFLVATRRARALPAVAVFVGAFLVAASPLLVATARAFGSPFHNANTAHVMWEAAGEDQQWRWSTATPATWWAAHGLSGTVARLLDGAARVTHGPLLYALLAAAAAGIAIRRRGPRGPVAAVPGPTPTTAFVGVAVATALVWGPAFAWYVPIANGRRYLFPVAALALPALVAPHHAFVAARAPALAARADRVAAAGRRAAGHVAAVAAAALALVAVEVREAAHPPAVGPRVPFDRATLDTAARLRALPEGTRILAGPAATVPSPWLVSATRDYVHLPPGLAPADAERFVRAHADVVLLSENLTTRRAATFGPWARRRPDGAFEPADLPPWARLVPGTPAAGPHLLFAVEP